ncbi:hypothetical protein ACJVC5_11595 [Peredibacter sp. HCB2-198]|uniref:hypothetical protein n=1 Tax=Peredibacter sp. HCB2-198 TaxID=3383025 RepID=UPI0038B5C49D
MDYGHLQDEVLAIGCPFKDIDDISQLIDKIKNKKIVMLGESSHGTKEFMNGEGTYHMNSLQNTALILLQ